MRSFFSIIFLIVSLQTTASCRWISDSGTSYFSLTNLKVPDGTPTFQRGYVDGCSTVLYARGNVYYRTRYKYRFDPKLMGNSEYRFGHAKGYGYCFFYALSAVSGPTGSSDKYLFPYKEGGWAYGVNMGAGNINDAWGGMLGGAGNSPLGGAINDNSDYTVGGFNSIFGVLSGSGKSSAFGADPLWSGGSSGQFFGQE